MITVITDASWCPVTQAGGWASWAVQNGKRQKDSGPILFPTVNSTEAELCALVNGIHCAMVAFDPPPRTRLLVQSDSMGALTALDNLKGGLLQVKARTYLDQLFSGRDVILITRHVKGHLSSKLGARFYVNNWADKEAKKHMREQRKVYQNKQQSTFSF